VLQRASFEFGFDFEFEFQPHNHKESTSRTVLIDPLPPRRGRRSQPSCFAYAGQYPRTPPGPAAPAAAYFPPAHPRSPLADTTVLCSWLPLLFIPTNASPSFIFLFFVCTYFLNRPCLYCSFLLLVLFLTSCNWSERCFFDFGSNWFQPRPGTSFVNLPAAGETLTQTATGDINATVTAVVADMLNTTAGALATAATEKIAQTRVEWTGLGIEWLRSLLGRREWRIECLDLYIRL